MKTALLGLLTETSLHAGAGQSETIDVDIEPLQNERLRQDRCDAGWFYLEAAWGEAAVADVIPI